MKAQTEWLTVKINPPKLDVPIVARTSDKFGYGAHHEAFTFDSVLMDEDAAVAHLENFSFVEWLELPK